jgi:quercetin dioxygenase-like cupin family protein
MSAPTPTRRVVTGLGPDGKSCILIDALIDRHGGLSDAIWRSAIPADNSGSEDMAAPHTAEMLHDGGTNFILIEFPPGMDAFWHATDTIDYIVVLTGQITMVLEAEEVVLHPGEFIVDRGVNHAWRNDTQEPASMACVTIPALPVGGGRTI